MFQAASTQMVSIITKFDMDLVCAPTLSPRTSQLSQFSNSLPSPTTHATFNQFSQQLSCLSNSSFMDERKCSHFIWMLTSFSHLQFVAGDIENHTHLCLSPVSYTLHQCSPPHTYVWSYDAFIYPLPLLPLYDPPHFCASLIYLSIKI